MSNVASLTLNDILKTVNFKNTKPEAVHITKQIIPQKLANTEARTADESNDLQSQEMKIILPSSIIVKWTGSELLLALKLSGHTDTFTEI